MSHRVTRLYSTVSFIVALQMLERSGETSSLSGRSPKWELLGFRTVEVASVSDWKARSGP